MAQPETRSGLALTVGHSTRTFEQFADLMRGNGVAFLVDVRRFPHSRRHPQFDAESLPEELREAGIGYAHLPGLGGRRRPETDSPNTGWRNLSFRGYADHMRTPEFREDFRTLLEMCERELVCLMCSEAVWWRCHRRMISDALVVRGFPVEQHAGLRRQTQNALLPRAQIKDRVTKNSGRTLLDPPSFVRVLAGRSKFKLRRAPSLVF